MDYNNIIKRIVYATSDKAIRLADKENKIVLIVDRSASKYDIKKAVEFLFDVKVDKVNTLILPNGEKKAYVKLDKNYKATDVLQKLKII